MYFLYPEEGGGDGTTVGGGDGTTVGGGDGTTVGGGDGTTEGEGDGMTPDGGNPNPNCHGGGKGGEGAIQPPLVILCK